jgi:pimeloyl-ACP methyl ester carboxylesterase
VSTVELAVRDVGTGPPLVLLHAFPLSSAMWLAQRESLAPLCRVLTPDQRGFGGSPLGDDEPSLDACADDLAALLDRLDVDRVVLGGLSMGGYVAMAFLRRHGDRVRGLVLAGTKAQADPEPARANRLAVAAQVERDPASPVLLEQLLPALVGQTTEQSRPLVLGRVRALVQAAPAPAVAWAQRAMAARPDSFQTLRSCGVPALVVVGDEDRLSPAADARAMVDALPAGRLVVLPAAGHLSAVETPESFSDAVAGLLAELGTAGDG